MDVTMTHDRFGRSTQRTNGALTHKVSSTGAPQPDGALKNAASKKIRHYRQLYADKPDPVIFLPVAVNTSVIPLSRFFNSRRPAPLLNPSLVIFSPQSA